MQPAWINLHGATYVADVTFRRPELDADGVVVDIGRALAQLCARLSVYPVEFIDASNVDLDTSSRLIARLLRTTRPAFLTVGMVSFIGIALWPQLGQSLLPDFKERDFLMHWVTAPGTSVQEETRISIAA